MKLSELTFEMPLKPGYREFNIHYDASDRQRRVFCPEQLEEVKKQLMEKYGDVEIVVDPYAPWFDVVRITDERWVADHSRYINNMQAICERYHNR